MATSDRPPTPSRVLVDICNLGTVPTIHIKDCVVTGDALSDAFGYLEMEDTVPTYIFIHPKRIKELVHKGKFKKELSCVGHLYSVPIFATKKIDQNEVYMIGTPNFVGNNIIVRVIFKSNSRWNAFKKKIRAWLGRE